MEPQKLNLRDYVPAIMAIGTWAFQMYCAVKGISWTPDDWIVAVILSPYGARVYSSVRSGIPAILKRLPKLSKKD